jgi:hypothetical protein
VSDPEQSPREVPTDDGDVVAEQLEARPWFKRRRFVLLLALIAVAVMCGKAAVVASRGGGPKVLTASEERSYRAAVELRLGHPVADWPAQMKRGQRLCAQNKAAFSSTLAIAAGKQGGLYLRWLQVRHQCPNRVDDLVAVVAILDRAQEACDLSPADRTADQSLLAEELGC